MGRKASHLHAHVHVPVRSASRQPAATVFIHVGAIRPPANSVEPRFFARLSLRLHASTDLFSPLSRTRASTYQKPLTQPPGQLRLSVCILLSRATQSFVLSFLGPNTRSTRLLQFQGPFPLVRESHHGFEHGAALHRFRRRRARGRHIFHASEDASQRSHHD
jgi:hypothetical protein